MHLLQLKYFQVAAHTEHMTNAANQLNIAQPALSKSISLLEEDLGVKLFDRRGRKIKLNFYGKTFLKRVDSILNLVDISIKELKDFSSDEFGQVKLIVLAASNLIPDILGEFRKLHPNISFKLIQHVPNSFLDYDFAVCITSSYVESKALNYMTLLNEEVFLGVSYDHPLSKFDNVYLNEVQDEDFICLEKGENFREITDTFCTYANFNPNIVFECDSPSTVHSLIKGGHGIGFMSGTSWGLNYDSSIKLLHINDVRCERFLELFWPNDKYMNNSTKLFINFVQEYFSKLRFSKNKTK
ncbi:LysR family transcriptional regulator [Clostridium sp.]|uniref:LysR family transcriptional regulator n=1 Tax=Clostridium sp. TaxID=1506 RepID=UPI003217CF58